MKESKVFDVLIKEYSEIIDELRELSHRDKELRAQKEILRNRLISAMDAAGTDLARSANGTISVLENDYPKVNDWDAFYNEIHRKKMYYLLERRPAAEAFREFVKMVGRPPRGVSVFKKRSIHFSPGRDK